MRQPTSAGRRTPKTAPRPGRQAPAPEKAPPMPGVAAIVKTLRRRANLTLSELARRSGVASSTISKIESGLLSPGYEIIVRLAQGLQVDVAEMFKPRVESVSTGRRGVTRRGDGVRYETRHYTYHALVPEVARKEFLPLVATIKARNRLDWDQLPAHEGEEFVYVLDGEVVLHSEHYEPLTLRAGDCTYFDSRAGHALISAGEKDAQVLWICSHRDAMKGMQGAG